MQNGSDEDISARQSSIFEMSVIALILLVSITLLLWRSLSVGHQSSEPESALIYIGDKLAQEVNLRQNTLISLAMNNIQIEVKEGKVRVAKSNCPKQICVNTAWIKTPGQTIVCVPYKIVIQIKATDPTLLDAVVY